MTPQKAPAQRLYSKETAIVTGGAGFIGGAICDVLAEQGAAVVCADIDTDKLEATASRVAKGGGRILALPCDLRNRRRSRRWWRALIRSSGARIS